MLNSTLNKSTVILALDLIFDYNSLLFSSLRTIYSKQNIFLKNELRNIIELKDPQTALQIIDKFLIQNIPNYVSLSEQQLNSSNLYFLEILNTIKPQIFVMKTIEHLNKNGINVVISTYLNKQQVNIIQKNHSDWLSENFIYYEDKEQYKQKIDEYIQKLDENVQKVLVLDGRIENIIELENIFDQNKKIQKLQLGLIQNCNFKSKNQEKPSQLNEKTSYYKCIEHIKWNDIFKEAPNLEYYVPEYKLSLDKYPSNYELKGWYNVQKYDKSFIVKSKIIHGFGRGGRQLGIHTANLEMTEEITDMVNPFLPGVYYGISNFVDNEQNRELLKEKNIDISINYPSVMSIGFNPYYENTQKTFEVHLIKQFDEDFYDSELEVQVLGFIRCESDFKSFDHLIKYIHNDVQVAKDIIINNENN